MTEVRGQKSDFNKRRALCAMLSALCFFFAMLFALSSVAEAQQPGKVHRIGFLSARPGVEAREEAFRQGLREVGYREGQNIVIEWRFTKGKIDRFPEFAAELVGLKVDVIVAGGSEASFAAKNATRTVPIVFPTSSDPVGVGLVASLGRPGGNVTGLSIDAPGLSGKRLELLKESFPGISRVAVLYFRPHPARARLLAETEDAARLLRVQLQPLGVADSNELQDAFAAMLRERAEALVKLPSAVLTSYRTPIVELAAKSRLPAIYEDSIIAEAGGLMSYGTDISDLYRRAAYFVDKIIKGSKPAELAVEQPTKFEFVINLKTMKQMGVAIPPNVLARADKVIK